MSCTILADLSHYVKNNVTHKKLSKEDQATVTGNMLLKFGHAIFEICQRTDKQMNRQTHRQTDKQTDTLIATLCLKGDEVINSKKTAC